MDILHRNQEYYGVETVQPDKAASMLERLVHFLVLTGFTAVLALETWLLIRVLIS
ncbi:MAG: hypothetical protein JXA97_06655 [Anaerolineales bacterium]|nr:hypothetical protein [Anaerolineales bacterium]